MAKRDLSRFERIEKERPASHAASAPAPGRFDGVAPEPPLHAPAASPAPNRFEHQGPQLSAGVAAEAAMIRCPRCQTDNGKFEHVCLGCRGRLDDDDTRAYNELLLDLWKDAQAAERATEAQKRDEAIAELSEVRAAERAAYEVLARKVAEQVKSAVPDEAMEARLLRWAEAGRQWLAARLAKRR